MNGMIIGTAGHIDHGKTSLVRALTGTDTDRLAEEKRRGISIDLGFAHLALPNGRTVSFIDVPGHERFVKNMLAGAGGIQAVLLVVAADESVKPQTREHFDICRLLGIRRGIVALTKADIASSEQMETAVRAVRELCRRTFLAGGPLVPVSAVTGQGLPELIQELIRLAESVSPNDKSGLVRLPVDRSFALRGFGTVVTGTLWNGRLVTGGTVEVLPSKRRARIRGLQVHGENVEEAVAGQRTAVNLAGIDHTEIQRGDVLVQPDELQTTTAMDVLLDWLPGHQTEKQREEVLLHLGTDEIPGTLKILRPEEDGASGLARLLLQRSVLALPGDRLVLRRPSPANTIAGGTVVDAFPALQRSRTKAVARLDALLKADFSTRIYMLVEESKEGLRLRDLVRITGTKADAIREAIQSNPNLLFLEEGACVLTKTWLQNRRTKLFTWLTAFHAKNPSAAGAPLSAARLGLPQELAAIVVKGFPAVRLQGETISLANHRAQFDSQQIRTLAKIEAAFRQGGFHPPLPNEVLEGTGLDAKQSRALLESLVKGKRLVRISESVIFHSEVMARIRQLVTTQKGKKFSIPEFKEWMNISRKYAIPLLEYLDREHVTQRQGDMRVVL